MNVSLSYTLALAVGAAFTFVGRTSPGGDARLPEAAVQARHAGGEVAGRCGHALAGFVHVTRRDETVRLFLNVLNAPPGEHAVRLHQTGDCSAFDAASANAEWRPRSSARGQSPLGQLGNLHVDDSGRGQLALSIQGWALGNGSETDLVGRALVIHERPGELLGSPGPDARIGCSVISSVASPAPRFQR